MEPTYRQEGVALFRSITSAVAVMLLQLVLYARALCPTHEKDLSRLVHHRRAPLAAPVPGASSPELAVAHHAPSARSRGVQVARCFAWPGIRTPVRWAPQT